MRTVHPTAVSVKNATWEALVKLSIPGQDALILRESHMQLRRLLALGAVAFLMLPVSALAQSTDGFHEIQVFPVVVDSTSFSQRFDFRAVSSSAGAATFYPRYFPARGTTQLAPIDCPSFEVSFRSVSFDGLRTLCPSLAAGSQFGFLVIEQRGPLHLSFSGFSRVSNPAGAGFAVEAFPAHTFTSAISTVAGLSRKAAGAGAPAFQTNCFVGLMGEHEPAQAATKVLAGLLDSDSGEVGAPLVLDLLPGEMVRLLDVFAAVGAPAGDHEHITLVVRPVLSNPDVPRPGIVSFCTVQDNTSFGADFRISKQEYGILSSTDFGPAAYDGHVMRVSLTYSNAGGPIFSLGTASFQQNTHVFYFRHPDWVSCEIVDPSTYARMSPERGLEMRLLAWDTNKFTPLAGGPVITGFDRIYLGDKRQRAEGFNTEYLLQVENYLAAPGSQVDIDYALRCWSGSGHTRGDMITYRRDANDF